jgi:hypothetical protein
MIATGQSLADVAAGFCIGVTLMFDKLQLVDAPRQTKPYRILSKKLIHYALEGTDAV